LEQISDHVVEGGGCMNVKYVHRCRELFVGTVVQRRAKFMPAIEILRNTQIILFVA